MTYQPPPIYSNLVGDDAKAVLPWILFFQQMYDGDAGTDWTPTFVSLTTAGTPTITGRYYKLGKYLTYFRATIVPATSTTATAGSTYIDNYPLTFKGDGIVFAMRGGEGSTSGHIVAANNRIYVPAWSTVTSQLSLVGIAEAT